MSARSKIRLLLQALYGTCSGVSRWDTLTGEHYVTVSKQLSLMHFVQNKHRNMKLLNNILK